MHMVAFMYPNAPGATFNFEHFIQVHLPLGVGLTDKHLHIRPRKIVVYSPTAGGDGTSASAAYITISSVFFDTQAEAETFAGLFEVEEAARRLSEDFPNYTPAPPEVLVAEVVELHDMDALVSGFERMEAE